MLSRPYPRSPANSYSATREFTDFSNPLDRCTYFCEVRESPGPPPAPVFAVTPRGAEECAGEGPTPQAAFNAVSKRMAVKGGLIRANRVTVPGAELFGLTNALVVGLLKARGHSRGKEAGRDAAQCRSVRVQIICHCQRLGVFPPASDPCRRCPGQKF